MDNRTTTNVIEHINRKDWQALRELVSHWPAPEIADLLMELENVDRVLLFRVLPRICSSDVFAYLETDQQNRLLADLTNEETLHLLESLSPDDRTQLFEELPGQVTQKLLNLLNPEDLREARQLLGYPEESIGRLMTPDYVAVREHWTVGQALEHLRARGRGSETINVIYVTDAKWKLLDALELRRFIFADPSTTVAQIMDHAYTSVSAFDDREEAVRVMQRYDLDVLPVVDSSGVLVGIVTADDVLDVAQEEATEDFHKGAAVAPLRTSYREARFRALYLRRIPWLLGLVFMNIFSGGAIAAFEDTLAGALALAFFLPLLIDSGGNAGSQSATLMVRALATGDVKLNDWTRILLKEILIAITLGLTMALAVSLIGFVRGGPEIALVVSLTMVLVVIVGSTIGVVLPFVLSRFNFDPATASAPLITSLADISGVLIYFSLATWLLGTPA